MCVIRRQQLAWFLGATLCLVTGCSTFKLSSQTLSEPSGLAASSHHADVFWTHDDSGGNPEIFAVNRVGEVLGVFKVEGAEANDWEAIATDRKGKLYIGDFGNNRNKRRDLVIYQVREPSFEPGEKPIQGTTKVERAVRFFYPEQTKFPDKKEKNFDAESLFWDSGSLYLLTKHRSDMSTTLYTVPIQESSKPLPAKKLGVFDVGGDPGNFGGRVTGADLSADGQYLAVLTYHAIFIFERPAQGMNFFTNLKNRIALNQDICDQVEGIAWDGDALLFNNEDSEVFRVTQPHLARDGTFP